MTFTVIIPARLASTRLPEKVLLDIAGKPMVRHVYERACESGAERVIVAVDDERVADALGDAETCRTSPAHRSGTERIAEVVERLAIDPDAVIVNVQADEPLLPPALIRQVAANLAARPAADVATLCEPMASVDEVFDPNAVKVVRDRSGFALYFSRAPIAWRRDAFPGRDGWRAGEHFRHLGLYAYRAGYVRSYVRLPRDALEVMESLEQLRVLAHGGRIHVGRGGGDAGSGGRYRGGPRRGTPPRHEEVTMQRPFRRFARPAVSHCPVRAGGRATACRGTSRPASRRSWREVRATGRGRRSAPLVRS